MSSSQSRMFSALRTATRMSLQVVSSAIPEIHLVVELSLKGISALVWPEAMLMSLNVSDHKKCCSIIIIKVSPVSSGDVTITRVSH